MSSYKTISITGRTTDNNGDIIWPVSVAQMKQELLITHSLQDDVIYAKIGEATEELEKYLGMIFIDATVVEAFDGISYPFPFFKLSVAPVSSIDSFSYYLNGYQGGTVSDFLLDDFGRPQIIQLKPNKSLPDTDNVVNRFKFTMTVGFGTTGASVPEPIKKAIKARVVASFEERGDRAKKYLDMSYSYVRNYKNAI